MIINETHPHLIFVYGTLKSGHGNNPLLVRHDSVYVGPAATVGKFLLNDGFPYVWVSSDEPREEKFVGRVRGELYNVSDVGLQACDMLEGHPHAYCRTPIEVEFLDRSRVEQRVTAGIYLMSWRTGRYVDLQEPDKDGYLEWGRGRQEEARNLQRATGRRFSKQG